MTNDDKPRFLAVINALAGVHRIDATESMVDGYWFGLRDIDIDTIEAAAEEALRSHTWMPKPVELRRLCGDQSTESSAAEAWPDVVKFARGDRIELDEITAEVVRQIGGKKRLGMMDEDEFQTWGRKEFERLYEMQVDREAARERSDRQLEARDQRRLSD